MQCQSPEPVCGSPGLQGQRKSSEPVALPTGQSDSQGSHSSSSSALGGVTMASPTAAALGLGSRDTETACGGGRFPSGWRDAAGVVPEAGRATGHVGRSPACEVASREANGDSADVERRMKEFVAGLGAYFQMEGQNGGPVEELRLNANALGSRRGPPSSSSQFRGVTRHRRTKKWESHIWYNKKQLYLGGFKEAVDAAKAHDIMALKLRGSKAHTNFEPNGYLRLLLFLDHLSMDQVIEALRMVSKGADFGSALKKPFRSSRTVKHHHTQSAVDRLVSSADDDATLVRSSGRLPDNIHPALLSPMWTKEHVFERATMEDLGSAVMVSPHAPDLLASAALEANSANLMDDGIDGTWAPIMCTNDMPLFTDVQTSPFLHFSQPLDIGMGQMEQRPQSEMRTELEMLCGQSPRGLMAPVLPMAQRTVSEPIPAIEDPGYSLQELLSQAPRSARQVADPASAARGLYQQQDPVVVKLPVFPSKVVQYSNAATRAASMPTQLANVLPSDNASTLWNQPLSEVYTSSATRSTVVMEPGVLPPRGESIRADPSYPMSAGYVTGVRELECDLQLAAAMGVQGQYGPEQFRTALDSRGSSMTRLSSTGSGVTGLGLGPDRLGGPRGHCL